MKHSEVKYNLKWGNYNKRASLRTAQICAQYKRRFLSVLDKNKELVRALIEAQEQVAYFKEAASRWDKNECLHLPMLKALLEEDLDHILALRENGLRASALVKGLLTPGANVSLTAADILLNESTMEPSDEQQASPHPPGSRYRGRDRSLSIVLEEEQNYIGQLQPEPEIDPFSRVTLRKKNCLSGLRRNLLLEEPLHSSYDQPSVLPAAAGRSSHSPGRTEAWLRSPTCASPTQFMSRNTVPPEKLALSPVEVGVVRVEKDAPEARTPPRQAVRHSGPSEHVMAGDADVAIQPGQSVNQQQDEGVGGEGLEDGETEMQLQQCSAALDVTKPRPKRNAALQTRRNLCHDQKPPQANKSRGRKKNENSKAPAPPQPADPSPSHTRRRFRLPLAEPVAAGPSSSVGEGSPPRRSSGRPSRAPPKCLTYKEGNLKVKLRRE